MPPRSASTGESIARRAAALAEDLKATDIVVLDLRGVTDMTDFFVIASGTSDTHVRAVADHVQAGLKESGVSTTLTEGLAQGRWAVLDYMDCVVHVFHPTLRQFYQLERLWGDATPVSLATESQRSEQSDVASTTRRATR
jgi:ribosome-associated protein